MLMAAFDFKHIIIADSNAQFESLLILHRWRKSPTLDYSLKVRNMQHKNKSILDFFLATTENHYRNYSYKLSIGYLLTRYLIAFQNTSAYKKMQYVMNS